MVWSGDRSRIRLSVAGYPVADAEARYLVMRVTGTGYETVGPNVTLSHAVALVRTIRDSGEFAEVRRL